jgi:hypothetical protein
MSRQDQARGDVSQMVHIRSLAERRAGQEGTKVARGHTQRPEVTDDVLRLGRAHQLGEDKHDGLRRRRHGVV